MQGIEPVHNFSRPLFLTVSDFDAKQYSVTINNEPADFGMKVPYGSIIKTGAEAYCEIVFENKNVFRIMKSTVVNIKLSIDAPEIIKILLDHHPKKIGQWGAFGAIWFKKKTRKRVSST